MEYKIYALSIYEYGQRKDKDGNPHQEDWIYPAMGAVNNDKDRLFILCDGMGGHSAGEVASEAVCEAMSKTINAAVDAGEKFSDALLLKAISNAYDLLDERDTCEDAQKKMGTTMTFLMLHEQGATIAHIGDSRVYLVRPKTGTKADIVFQTRDHSLVNDLLKAGELTPEEAETFPRKNVITRAMQPKQEYRCKADIKHVDVIMPGDYFYMCSDGMLEQTSNDNLCYMLNMDVTDEEKRNMLVKVSKDNKDNHSAHLIHILDVEPKPAVEDASPAAPASFHSEQDNEDLINPEFENAESGENSGRQASEQTFVEEVKQPSACIGHVKDQCDNRKTTAISQATYNPQAQTSQVAPKQVAACKDKVQCKTKWFLAACILVAIIAVAVIGINQSPQLQEQWKQLMDKMKPVREPQNDVTDKKNVLLDDEVREQSPIQITHIK